MRKPTLHTSSDERFPAVEAVFTDGAWRLRRRYVPEATVTDEDRATAADQVNDLLGDMLERLSHRSEIWRLELSKAAFAEARTTLGLSRSFVAAAMPDRSRPHLLAGRGVEASVGSVAAAFRIAGEPVANDGLRRFLYAARAIAALFLGLAAFVVVLLQALRWPSRIPDGVQVGIAIHAEVVNRTGHILKVLPERDPATTALIIIGRPKIGLAATRRMLHERGWRGAVVRCFDLPAAIRSLPSSLRTAIEGVGAIVEADYLSSFREMVAAMFRVFLGAAAATWWPSQETRPEVIVFGHNGLADTVQLERAQQRSGSRTVHWMHGVSAGRIYTGVSDVCVYQCGHDARWHDRLGGYGRNMSFPAARPAYRTGAQRRWGVMTNFTHPGYTFYPTLGPAHELRLMEIVAQAADRAGLPRDAVMWKPHPVFFLVEPETRRLVTEALDGYGFTLWPQEDRDFSRCAEFETIIATPSGVALDVLKLGRLPVMVALHSLDPDHHFSCFPLRTGDADGLTELIGIAADPARAPGLFDQAWAGIDPGRLPEFDEVVGAARPTGGMTP